MAQLDVDGVVFDFGGEGDLVMDFDLSGIGNSEKTFRVLPK